MCDYTNSASEGKRNGLCEESHGHGGAIGCGPGKSTGITMKVCPALERGTWCQVVPQGHDKNACHTMSQKRRGILDCMKMLLNAQVNQPVCPEWDTSTTCENTPGPYRFGVNTGSNNDNYKIIGSKLTQSGCECIKRNGLQDDCPLPRCRGSPACKVKPFPQCEPFLNIPDSGHNHGGSSGVVTVHDVYGGDHCRCPVPYC